MKKINLILVTVSLLMCNLTVNAQDKSSDYFVGTWELLVEGTPEGDGIMVVDLSRNDDGKLTGTLSNKSKETKIIISQVDEKEKDITIFYTSDSGFDINIYIKKVGDNDVSGNIMNMFDLTGKRVGMNDDKK